jgi:VIT1/CCC1 family predicted Fe2+/Mn2+ transporter
MFVVAVRLIRPGRLSGDAVAAKVGGASIARGALRVAFWEVLAMGASALVGRLFGRTVT